MSEHKERKTLEERQQMSDLERLRHSCAHVLATAICRLWPDAGGPAVDNGFYYDVELDHRISTEDFERIEEEMKKVVKENQVFQKEVISRADAMKMAESGELGALGPRSEPSRFKIDLLNDIPEDEEISLYRNGDFTDLCAGPHVGRTGNCKAFKIMSVASAFYKGDKNRPMLQRIYGTCFPNRTQLDEHLERLEEARRRDHRKLGRELGLPEYLVMRQPFPGPGLGIRIIGEVTPEKVAIVQDADAIWREEIAKAGLDKEISQYYAALTNMHSVGVMGDERTYDYAVALRAVTTTDFMTAESYDMPWDVLGTVTSRIVNEVKHVNRVFYDCTGKPPATIELE